MFKKSILSIAIASSMMLTGCLENNKTEDENGGSITNPLSEEAQAAAAAKLQRSYPVFSPVTGDFPRPNDLLFQKDSTATSDIEQSDGSFAIPGSGASDASPPVVALENLSGASLTAPIDIEIGHLIPGTGNVDETTLDARSFVDLGSGPVPNPNQNVFLIELEYASDDPIKGITFEAPTASLGITAAAAAGGDLTAGAKLAGLVTTPAYDAKLITLKKSNGVDTQYIRINPLTPLNPNKRYIIALTDGVKDLAGESLIASPGSAGYEALTDETIGLASTALAPVRSLINGLWEKVAAGYFEGLTNPVRSLLSLDALTANNIIFSISITTSNDTKVIDYMAEPNTWISDTLKSMVKGGAAQAATAAAAAANTSIDYAGTKTAVDNAYNNWMASSFNALLAPCDAYPAGAAQFSCAGTALEGYLTGTVGLSFPKPAADTDITFASQRDLRTVSAAITDSIALAGEVNISEGHLTIPYYQEVPNARGTVDASIANLVNGWWKADSGLADGLSAAFGLTIPQATPAEGYIQSNVVNAFYPFPKVNATLEIPILAVYPASDVNKPADGYKTIIYQHGITTDRSVALTLGSAIVKNSGGTVAVIAIDQPLHGVDVASPEDKGYWAETFLAGAGLISPDGVFDGSDADLADQARIDAAIAGTLNIGSLQIIKAAPFSCPALATLDVTGAVPADIVTAISEVSAGNCGATAKGLYDGAVLIQNTVANSASIIPGLPRDTDNERHFDFAGVNLQPVPMDFTNGSVGSSTNTAFDQPNTGSGSLNINIANFLTSRDNFRQQIVDLLTLRLSVPHMDLDDDGNMDLDTNNVHFIGHSLGTLNGIPFVEIANQTATDADNIVTANFLTPGGNIARLAENSEAFAPSIFLGLGSAAGLARGDTDLEAFLNVFQIAFDSFDPINFVGSLDSTTSETKALFTEVVGDGTIPNSASPALDIVQPDDLILLTVNGDYSVSKNVIANPYAGISFGPGTDAPLAGTDPLETVSGATAIDSTSALGINFLRFASDSGATHGSPVSGDPAVFAQIVESALTMVATDGASVVVSNTGLIQDAD